MSDAKNYVPTGVVPRVNPVAELERQLLQPDPPPGPMKGIAHFTPPDNVTTGVFDASAPGGFRPTDPIAQAVDDYLLMERKARAWDMLEHLAQRSTDPAAPLVVDLMGRLVHPAQKPSTR